MTDRWACRGVVLGLVMLIALPACAQSDCFGSRDIDSPDGALQAHVTRLGRIGCGESRVEFFDKVGHLLATADYGSYDGESGEGVAKAAWSPDSQYFVYSLVNSGKDRPKQILINIYARKTNKIHAADQGAQGKAIAIADPSFTFGANDSIKVTGRDGAVVELQLGTP